MSRAHCINCSASDLHTFLDFGLQPNGNNFLDKHDIENEPLMPLSVMLCGACGQVQQGDSTSAEFLFSNHPYLTGVSKPYVEHFERMVPRLIETLGLRIGATVMDIGCNDGSLLGIFAKHGIRGIGVDPGAASGKVAARNGHMVLPVFWGEQVAQHVSALKLRPDLIIATAAFYHMEKLNDWVAGLAAVMSKTSVFVAQCVYLGDIVRNGQVDQFYHEHSCIHSVRPLKALFERHGLRLFRVEPIDVQGGSILVYACRIEADHETDPSVEEYLEQERRDGLADLSRYEVLRADFERNARELRDVFEKLNADGKRVFAIGGSLRGVTLLNFAKIPKNSIEKILEVNDYKIGKYSPGLHIPVTDERLETGEPDSYIVLSWTFRDFFIEKYQNFLDKGGSLIFPVPELEVVRTTTE